MDRQYCWDIGSWNVAGARLQPRRGCGQACWPFGRCECRKTRLLVHPRRGRGIDISKKHHIEAIDMQRRRSQVTVTEKNGSYKFNIMVACIPPTRSRHYNDEEMETTTALADTRDFMCGEFN